MKQHKNKIIFALLVIVLLVFSFFYGGSTSTKKSEPTNVPQETVISGKYETDKSAEKSVTKKSEEKTTEKKEKDVNTAKKEKKSEENKTNNEKSAVRENTETKISQNETDNNEKTQATEEKNDNKSSEKNVCTLSVTCGTILNNLSALNEEKRSLVPEDGIIYKEKEVSFYEGESVFNVLLREMKQNKIHFEFVNVPVFKSAYIEGIANLYEFDCGELSGWMYRVNGEFPNYGCSQYIVKNGDKIEWLYTCDLGKDIGGENSAKNGISK